MVETAFAATTVKATSAPLLRVVAARPSRWRASPRRRRPRSRRRRARRSRRRPGTGATSQKPGRDGERHGEHDEERGRAPSATMSLERDADAEEADREAQQLLHAPGHAGLEGRPRGEAVERDAEDQRDDDRRQLVGPAEARPGSPRRSAARPEQRQPRRRPRGRARARAGGPSARALGGGEGRGGGGRHRGSREGEGSEHSIRPCTPGRGTSGAAPSRSPGTRPRVVRRTASRAAVELRHHELAVAERLGRGEAAVGGAHDHLDQRVAGLRDGHVAAQDAGHVEVDVLRTWCAPSSGCR